MFGSMVDFLITNGLIVTVDNERRIIKDGAIAVEDSTIIDVGKSEELERRYSPETTIDAKNNIVFPGFINGHTHVSAEMLIKGFVPDTVTAGIRSDQMRKDSNLSDIESGGWLRNWTGLAYEAVTEEDEYYSSLWSFVECIKTGTTTICDGGTIHSIPSVIRAMQTSGIRGVIGKWVWDVPQIPTRMAQNAEDGIKSNDDAVRLYDKSLNGRVSVWPMLVGDFPIYCTDELLIGSKKVADKYHTGFSLHQSSFPNQVDDCLKKTGKRPVEHFEALGILDSNVRLVHMVHVSDNELRLLKKYGVKVCQNSSAMMKVGNGTTKYGKFPEMIKEGISVGLGTDSPNGSNSLDLVRQMYLASSLYKDARMDPTLVPAETALEMATIMGADTILQSQIIGSIEKGKKADIVIFDGRRPQWVPLHKVVNSLVYSADGSSVDTVLIDGKLVLDKGRMVGLDEDELASKIQEMGDNLVSRTGLSNKKTTKWKVS
jgi:5-methylthioadenosine/S-adenosylhomocysteine deaminase